MINKKSRAKNIDHGALEAIVGILDGWSGKLTWDLLIECIDHRTKVLYTRQALDRHPRIKDAFSLAKQRVGQAPTVVTKRDLSPAAVSALEEKFERMKAENARLILENERLFEQFVRWAYNAHLRGLTKDFLNSPLPGVDRERTLER
ncbi:MAG: hypothetical protein V4719_03075 [Planctomycetota bacterium]